MDPFRSRRFRLPCLPCIDSAYMFSFGFSRPLPLLTKLFFFLALSVLVMAADHRDANYGRGWLLAMVYPLQSVAQSPGTLWSGVRDNLKTRETLKQENARLANELARVRPQLMKMSELEKENQRLLALLGAAPHERSRVMVARVIGASSDPLTHVITLDQGSASGVVMGQAVMAANGAVGQVIRVGPLTSQAALLTDAGHSLPAQIMRTRRSVLVNGIGDDMLLSIPFMPHNADILPGDVLMTSGLGGSFPKGIPIGRVLSVNRKAAQNFADIKVVPWVKLDRLEEVLLLWPLDKASQESQEDNTVGKNAS